MSNKSVLIVEDTPINLKMVRVIMQRAGFDVRTATSAEEALEVLRHFRPRVVLTDIQLPGIDGLALTKHLKSSPDTRDIIVLALTAFAMKSDKQRALEAGCDGYITKPIDTRTFPDLIRQFIGATDDAASISESASTRDAAPFDFSLDNLKQSFIANGMQQSERFVNSLNTDFNYAEVQSEAHRWAGAAGQIGYVEIAECARQLEALLHQRGTDSLTLVRKTLMRLVQLFSGAREAAGPVRP